MKLAVKTLRTFSEKTRGLIGVHEIYPVFFTTRWGIHTFGMKKSIDVLILDDHLQIVRLIRNLPPNRIFLWSPRYTQVIELPAGTINRSGIKIQDRVTLTSLAS